MFSGLNEKETYIGISRYSQSQSIQAASKRKTPEPNRSNPVQKSQHPRAPNRNPRNSPNQLNPNRPVAEEEKNARNLQLR